MKDITLLKENGIDVEHSLELLGDIEMYDETLQDFLDEFEEKKQHMEQYNSENDMENYAILAHSLKSDSKYLGFTKLIDLAYNHEMESKANNSNYIKEHYDELMEEADRIISLVKEYLGN